MRAFLRNATLGLVMVLAVFANACTSSATRPNQATLTAQILRSQQLATRMAANLQSTSQVADRQVTVTAQAIQSLLDTAATWRAVFPMNFDASSDAWLTGDDSNEYGSSKWTILQGKYHWEASATQGMVWWSIPDMLPIADFYLSVLANQISGPPDSLLGLAFRVTGEEDGFYLFQVNTMGEYAVYQLENGDWIARVPWNSSPAFQAGQPNQLAVLGQGSHFYFFINGSLVDQMTDDNLPTGTAGLVIGLDNAGDTGAWEFENFQVSTPPGLLIPTTPIP